MKRLLGILTIGLLTLSPGLAAAQGGGAAFGQGHFCLTVGAGMRSIKEDIADSLYGSNNLAYSLDLAYGLGPWVDLFIHTDYLKVEGETTMTAEPTSLRLVPLELGMRVRLQGKRLEPYAGFGAGYYMVTDEIEIDNETFTFKKNQVGFFLEGGLRVYITGHLFVHLQGRYILLKVKPGEASSADSSGILYYSERDLGGFLFSGGLGIRF